MIDLRSSKDNQGYHDRSNFWSEKQLNIKSLDQQLISGFQVAANSGPMMEEPMAGVGFRFGIFPPHVANFLKTPRMGTKSG